MKRSTMKNFILLFSRREKEKIWQMASYKNNAVALAKEVIYLFTHLFPVLPMERNENKRGQR